MSILSELSQAEQQYSNKLNQPTNDYASFIDNISRREVDPTFDTVTAAQQDADALARRNEYAQQDSEFRNRVQAKIDALIDKRIQDPRTIFDAIVSDPDLSLAYPTDLKKDELIQQVQNTVSNLKNPLNALEGYNVEGEGGFWSGLAGSAWSGIKNTVYSPYSSVRKRNTLNELNNLPLNQLKGIDTKIATANDLRNKAEEAEAKLLSPDLAARTQALRDMQYYTGTLKNLELTPEEQQIWNTYGDKYRQLSSELEQINANKADFVGSQNISNDEARILMEQYARREQYKQLGIDPSFAQVLVDGAKDSLSSLGSVGRSLGNVLSSAIPFLIHPALGAASFGSTSMEYASDLMEQYYQQNGEMPSKEQLKAAIYGALAAGIDYFGTKGLVKGYGAGKFFAGIGKNDAMRMAERMADNVEKSTAGLSRGLSRDAYMKAYAGVVRAEAGKEADSVIRATKDSVVDSFATKSMDALEKETLGTKLTRKIAEIPSKTLRGIAEAPVNAVKGIAKTGKVIAKVNQTLHKTAEVGAQDILKAGAGLAAENVGSSLVRQSYTGNYNQEEIAQGIVDGFISGGAFHGISNTVAVGTNALRGKGKELYNKYFNSGIDLENRSDFLASLEILKSDNPEDKKYTYDLGKLYSAKYEKLKEGVETLEKTVQDYTDNDSLKAAGFTIDTKTGDASINMAQYDASKAKAGVSLDVLKDAVKKYNDARKGVARFKKIIEARYDEIQKVRKDVAKQDYEESLKDNTLTEDQKDEIKQRYVDLLSEEEQVKFLEESEHITKEHAEEYIKQSKSAESEEEEELPPYYTEVNPKTNTSVSDILTNRGSTNIFLYSDILKNPEVRDAITEIDKAKFDKAIREDTSLSDERKKVVLDYFTKEKFEQFERGTISEDATLKDLNKATRRDIKKYLGVPEAEVTEEEAKNDGKKLEQYIYQKLLSPDFDDTPNSIYSPIREQFKDADDDVITGAIKKFENTVARARDVNNKLVGKKVYTSKEKAQEALDKLTKADKNGAEILKVSQIDDDRFVLDYLKPSNVTKAIDDLDEKADITEEDLNKFLKENAEDVPLFKDKDVVKGIKDAFKEYREASQKEVEQKKQKLIDTLNNIVDTLDTKIDTKAQELRTSETFRTAIHGYRKNQAHIFASNMAKREKELRDKAAKEDLENQQAKKEVEELSKEQAENLIANSFYRLKDYFRQPFSQWNTITRFTTLDVRNLQTLINSGKLDITYVRAANLLLSFIEQTQVRKDTTSVPMIDFSIVRDTPNADFKNELNSLSDLSLELEKTFKDNNVQIHESPMYMPESKMAESMKEDLASKDTDRQVRNRQRLERSFIDKKNEWDSILNTLANLKVTTKDTNGYMGDHSYLGQIYQELSQTYPELGIKDYPLDVSKLTDYQRKKLLLAMLTKSTYFLKALGLDFTATTAITADDAVRLKTSQTPVSAVGVSQSIFGLVKVGKYDTTKGHSIPDTLKKFEKIFETKGGFTDAYAEHWSTADGINRPVSDMLKYVYFDVQYPKSIDTTSDTEFVKLFGSTPDLPTTIPEAIELFKKGYAVPGTHPNKVLTLLLNAYATKIKTLNNANPSKRGKDFNNLLEVYSFLDTIDVDAYIPEGTVFATDTVDKTYLPALTRGLWDDPSITDADTLTTDLISSYTAEDKADINRLLFIDGSFNVSASALKELPEGLATKLAQDLAFKHNKNVSSSSKTVGNITGTNELSPSGNSVQDEISQSRYNEDIVAKPTAILASNIDLDAIKGTNSDYAGGKTPALQNAIREIKKLNKHATKFLDSGMYIDEIFGTEYQGRMCYSRDVVNVLSATGLNNLVGLTLTQSPDWLEKSVKNGRLTVNGAKRVANEQFVDYETFLESLGNQAIHSLGIHIKDRNSRVNIEKAIRKELGSRIIHLLESAGYVQKQYLDSEGTFHDIEPESGTHFRVLKLNPTNKESLLDIVKSFDYSFKTASDTKKQGHVLDDLLGLSKDNEPKSGQELLDNQKKLKDNFNKSTNLRTEKVKINTYNDMGVPVTRIYQVEIDDFNGVARVSGLDGIFIKNDKSKDISVKEFYLNRKATTKADGTINSARALVELAHKNLEPQRVYKTEYNDLFGSEITQAESWRDLPIRIQKALGMDTKKTVSIYEVYRDSKNSQIFRIAKEFDTAMQTHSDGDLVYYPVVMTPNNRFLVDTNSFNYREFKPTRDFFRPNNTLIGRVKGNRTKFQNQLLKATVLFNLGLDVDKMDFNKNSPSSIDKIFEDVTSAITKISADPNGAGILKYLAGNFNLDEAAEHFEQAPYNLSKQEFLDIIKPLTDIEFTVYKGVAKDGTKVEFSNSAACQIMMRDLLDPSKDLINKINHNRVIKDFHYMIEVDGLNNGSGHHFSQSDVFSNTDDISIAKAIAVGVIPSTYSGTYKNFISTMAANGGKFMDVYMMSADTANTLTQEDFATMLISGLNADRSDIGAKRLQVLKVLARIYGINSDKIEGIIRGLLDRNTMKKVAMPTTYGAGMAALLEHLCSNLDEKIAEYVAKHGTNDVNRLYSDLAYLNDGKLQLVDGSGEQREFTVIRDLHGTDIHNYIPVVSLTENGKLRHLLESTYLRNAVKGSQSVTVEASKRAKVLNQADEAIYTIFKASVKKALEGKFKDRDITSLTWNEEQEILSMVCTQINFGSQKQSLSLLKPALDGVLVDLYHNDNKITGFYEGGFSSTRFKTNLDKTSLGSTLPPVYIHGFDAGNIAHAQQLAREALGAFTGIHDAVMINFRQLSGDFGMSVPILMNRTFIEGALTSYTPLLQMAKSLGDGVRNVMSSLSGSEIADIKEAINALQSYAGLEINNTQRILYKLKEDLEWNANHPKRRKRPILTINQFGLGDGTAFTPDIKWVNEQIQAVNDSLKNIGSSLPTYEEFLEEFLKTKDNDLYRKLQQSKKTTSTISMLSDISTDVITKFGLDTTSKDKLNAYIKEYNKKHEAQGYLAVFKDFIEAQQYMNQHDLNFKNLFERKNLSFNGQEIVKSLITILNSTDSVQSGFYNQFISANLHKIAGLIHSDSNTGHALASLVQMTTRNQSINPTALNRLIDLMYKAGHVNSKFNITKYDSSAQSMFMNLTDINLNDYLNHVSVEAAKAKVSESEIHEKILKGYINNLKQELTKAKEEGKPVTQLIFRMDKSIDLMVMGLLNSEINKATNDSNDILHGVTMTIYSGVSPKAGADVDRDIVQYENIHTEDLKKFTVLAPTEYKNLDLQNFIYAPIYTPEGLSGQTTELTFKVSSDVRGGRANTKSSYYSKGTIYLADYFGRIEATNSNNTCTPGMLRVQHSPSDITGASKYENDIVQFDYDAQLKAYDGDKKVKFLENLPEESIVTTDFSAFGENPHIIISLDTTGQFAEKRWGGIIRNIPELRKVYEDAKELLEEAKQRYKTDPSISRDAIYQPIELDIANVTGINTGKVTFMFTKDPTISVGDFRQLFEKQNRAASTYEKGNVVFKNLDGLPRDEQIRLNLIRNKFKEDFRNNAYISSVGGGSFSSWVTSTMRSVNDVTEEAQYREYITIPSEYLNPKENTFESSHIGVVNCNKLFELSSQKNVIHFGKSSRPYLGDENTTHLPTVYTLDGVMNAQHQKDIATKFTRHLSHMASEQFMDARGRIRAHRYTSPKSEEDMNVYETGVYKDLTCKDADSLFNTLTQEDASRDIPIEHLKPVFNKLKSLNMSIRYYLNKLAYSQGGAFIETINAKPTGYINFNTRGTGSHAEVFIHEYTHIPLEYLKYDPNAYRLATQLYQFSAKNLTLEDFDCSREEANRIFNYIFRDSSTTDPQIEFLTYSLTNADFRKALDNMAKRVKFKEEFDSKTESLLARFVNKISGSLDTSHVSNDLNSMIFDIFKRSVDLCNEYGKKAPRNEKAYLAEKMQLSNADMIIQDAITSGLSKVSEALSSIADTSVQRVRTEEALRLAESNQDSRIANQMKDILPAMMDALPSASEGFQDIADQLRQSFEGVSDNNYAYVKLRYQAKETIDKARENSASALNEVIRKATKNISQKTLNEMSEYVLKSDMSCLVSPNGYSKQELGKILSDKKFRRNEIERLEKVLRHNTFGNFYVNASKGLVDKLLYGVNTSGIGYNNAYEIANMSGTATASLDSPMESEIDKYITLSVMDKLDSKNPKVYAELYKNLDTLTELLNIHNGLKSMEYSQVYPNSMQKVHIPKGELHGGKVTNKYTVVPKSQLKAYKWAGYNSLGKVKFDSFYNSLMKEDFYKVEAKHMPNVPYVDGIPVLTDIFNGRNKTGTYLGGKKLETTQINPMFNNVEMNALSRYIQGRVNLLNSPNYFVPSASDIDGVVTPTFGIGNKLSGCDFQLNEKDSDKYLNRHIKFTSALGDHYGSIIERMRAPDWNNQVAQALDDLYQQRHTNNDFTWLTDNSEKSEYVEIYKLLPYELKKFFNDKYNGKGVPVETRYLTGIVGYREISASKVDLEWNNKLRKSFTDYVSHIFHNGYVAKGENFLRYLTKLGKENIVIKGIAVSMDNILSNNVTLSVLGLSPEKVCKYQIEGLNNLLKYKEMSRERYMLKTKELTNSLTEGDRARIRALEASMHALPISYLAEHGGTPTIAEDVTETDRLAKDFIDTHFKREFQTIAHNAIGDQKSWVYKHLSDLATFGDITARYAQFKYLTEDKHINQEEAFRQCMQTFIDYSNPLPKSLQYFDSIGALPFTKFLLGNQTNVLNSLVRKPSRALAGIMATSAMGIPSIYDSILGLDSFTKRWKVPGFGLWYDSLGTLPINRAFDIL
jgi:hypothetical protein